MRATRYNGTVRDAWPKESLSPKWLRMTMAMLISNDDDDDDGDDDADVRDDKYSW